MSPEDHRAFLDRALEDCVAAAPDARVFGSCVRGKELPGDIDLFLEASPDAPAAMALLRAARRHYGWIDVFLQPPAGPMLVRNPWCTGWDVARHARPIRRAAGLEGVALAEFAPPWKRPPGEEHGGFERESGMTGPGPIKI